MEQMSEALSQPGVADEVIQSAPPSAPAAEPQVSAPAEPQPAAAQQPPAPEPQPAAQQPAAQEPATQEPAATPAPAPAAQPAAQPVAWQEAIKEVPVADLLKAAGFDDKLVKLYDLYKSTGDLTPYFQAYNTDYDKVPDSDLLKLQIQDEFKMLSPDEQELLYADELNKYKLDPELHDESAVRVAELKLKARVASFRETMKQRQQETIVPKADLAGQQQQSNQQSVDAGVQEYVNMLQSSPAFKAMQEKGVLQVGNGDTAFNIGVDAQKVFSYLTNPEVAMQNMMTADGKPDFAKQFLLGALATNTDQVIQVMVDRGRQMEKLALAKELGNEVPPQQMQNAKGAEKSPEQLLAERFFL